MSTAAVSGSSIFQELQSFYQTRRSDLKQLGSDLQSGNLSAAQQDFNALAALGEDGPFANAEPFSKQARVSAFNAVGEALAGGNLAQAQAAFASLAGGPNDSSDAATLVDLSSTQPSSAVTANDDANSIYQQLQAYRQQRTADLSQLGQDLQAGNLNAAQQDFNALTALGESGPSKNGQPFQRADRAADFSAIGEALQSGDLAGAQTAFASLSGTFGQKDDQAQTAISGYNSSPSSTSAPAVSDASTASAILIENIQNNFAVTLKSLSPGSAGQTQNDSSNALSLQA